MNRNWKDERNETSFKSLFCILSTELVYNQDKKCISPSKEDISINVINYNTLNYKIKLHAHAWACTHLYINA